MKTNKLRLNFEIQYTLEKKEQHFLLKTETKRSYAIVEL